MRNIMLKCQVNLNLLVVHLSHNSSCPKTTKVLPPSVEVLVHRAKRFPVG